MIRTARTPLRFGIVAAALLAAGCSGEPTSPAAPLSADGPLFQAGGAGLEQATGSGHFRQEGVKRTFAFNAQRRKDGSATGQFQVVVDGRTIHGTVTCLRVVGDRAWVGGLNPDGTEIGFQVIDGGEGKGAHDRVSYHYGGPGFASWTCAAEYPFPTEPIDAGNIQVRGRENRFTLVYSNDFSGPVGAEWSSDRRSTSPSGETYLGDFSDFAEHGVELSLEGLPEHRSLRISFDFYAIRTLDGNEPQFGLDLVTFGERESGFSFPTTFSGFAGPQAFPGRYPEGDFWGYDVATRVNELGYLWYDQATGESVPIDAVYRVEFTVDHTSSSAAFTFDAAGLQAYTDAEGNFTDESWGIDNLRVQAVR